MFRKALRFQNRSSRYELNLNPDLEKEFREWKKLESGLGTLEFRFREGFADRVTNKLVNLLEKDPMREFYYSLSSLLPKIAYSSILVLLLIILTVFFINGEIDHNVIMGAGKVDDSNFISYLIFQSN
jgi:hypothetical protein